MVDESSLPGQVVQRWTNWVSQDLVFGFNSGKYDLNLIKEHFVKNLSDVNDVTVMKKDNSYMFLATSKFKILDVKNYLAPGLSYDGWCEANACEVQMLYKWLDDYNKLSHVGSVEYDNFYSELKGGFTITQDEYEDFVREFNSRGCVMMMDWLRVYNEADIILFIKAVDKTRNQYYPNEIDMLKDAVIILGISMTYMLNKTLKMKELGDHKLYALGQTCKHKCSDTCLGIGCKDCERFRADCTQWSKNKSYKLLKTGMVGGPSIVFRRYVEVGKTAIRSHIYPDAKICKSVDGWDTGSLYLCCYGEEMLCGKESYIEVSNPQDVGLIRDLCDKVLAGE